MNRFETHLGRKLLWASMLPMLALIGCLLVADIIALNRLQRSTYQNSFELAHRLLSKIELISEHPIDQKKFSLIENILLSDTQIVGLSLTDNNNQILYQAGIAPHPRINPADHRQDRASHENGGNWIIRIPNNAQTWTLVLDDESVQLAVYHNLHIHLGIFAAALLFFALMYTRTKNNFFHPIRALNHYLLSLKLTPHHAVPNQSELTYLHDSARLLNDLIEGINQSQDEMRRTYEAALSDFKESLESVEIQNIEMDLARKAALQAERVKSEFLINASSDLLEPLRQSLGALGQLTRTQLDAEQADYINNLETTLRGIIGLAQDIVDFSRLENGKFQLELKNIRIRQVIHDALTFYAPLAATKNSRILSIIQPEIDEVLLGDSRRLLQVLGNLINKALDHGRQGNLTIKASVLRAEPSAQLREPLAQSTQPLAQSTQPSAQLVKFSVINNSGGFDDDFIQQFKRLLSRKNADFQITKGMTLGLSITQNLIEKMGGELGLDTEPASQVSIWFTARLQTPETRLQHTTPIAPLKGCNVLVIDEQPASRLELTSLLNGLGALCQEVTLMDDLAIQMPRWQAFKPQIAVLDVLNRANIFDQAATLNSIALINEQLGISCVVVANSACANALQQELDPINAGLINRPLLPGRLHQALAHQITMTPILGAINSTPKLIPILSAEYSHRILVVDDNPSNTKLVAEFLKRFPLEVATCSSGAKAIALCREQRFDLIFMDIQMPNADGFAVTAKIRELELGESRTPIVALTAQSASENKTKYIVGGMDDFLAKPVSYDDLIQLIAKWLGKGFMPSEPEPQENTPPKKLLLLEDAALPAQPTVVVHECLKLANDNPALARDMLQMLIDSLKDESVDLFQLMETQNWPALQHFAHTLFGGACYSGVPALKEAAQILDRALQQGQMDNLEQKVTQLQLEIQRLLVWSEDYDLDALFELA